MRKTPKQKLKKVGWRSRKSEKKIGFSHILSTHLSIILGVLLIVCLVLYGIVSQKLGTSSIRAAEEITAKVIVSEVKNCVYSVTLQLVKPAGNTNTIILKGYDLHLALENAKIDSVASIVTHDGAQDPDELSEYEHGIVRRYFTDNSTVVANKLNLFTVTLNPISLKTCTVPTIYDQSRFYSYKEDSTGFRVDEIKVVLSASPSPTATKSTDEEDDSFDPASQCTDKTAQYGSDPKGVCGCVGDSCEFSGYDWRCCHRTWGPCQNGRQACITVFGFGKEDDCSVKESIACSKSAQPKGAISACTTTKPPAYNGAALPSGHCFLKSGADYFGCSANSQCDHGLQWCYAGYCIDKNIR